MYGTAQFKVDKAHVWHVLDTTHFSFHTWCARKINDVETPVQSTCVRTRRVAEACVHVRYVQAKSGLRHIHLGVYTNCKPSIMI